jgi:hypothetical protein
LDVLSLNIVEIFDPLVGSSLTPENKRLLKEKLKSNKSLKKINSMNYRTHFKIASNLYRSIPVTLDKIFDENEGENKSKNEDTELQKIAKSKS